jgi:hypothetical protein
MSILDELDDDAFAEASRFVGELCDRLKYSIGRAPSSAEFLELVTAGIQSTNADLFSDVSPGGIAALVPKLKKVPARIEPGALIGVPAPGGGWFMVLLIVSNTFGHALGVFSGKRRRPGLKVGEVPTTVGRPVYASLHAVRDGSWRFLGVRPEFLDLFPRAPEIYHAKSENKDNAAIGEFGSAEAPDHSLRTIDRLEAETVGLLSGEYEQALLPEQVIRYLDRNAGS